MRLRWARIRALCRNAASSAFSFALSLVLVVVVVVVVVPGPFSCCWLAGVGTLTGSVLACCEFAGCEFAGCEFAFSEESRLLKSYPQFKISKQIGNIRRGDNVLKLQNLLVGPIANPDIDSAAKSGTNWFVTLLVNSQTTTLAPFFHLRRAIVDKYESHCRQSCGISGHGL
jgi:hypothetical protein